MYTRQDYMDGKCTHEQYFEQFVDNSILNFVANQIGERGICGSNDQHFNDIPLIQWDRLHDTIWRLCGAKVLTVDPCGNCLGTTVCIAKAAARKIKEYYQEAGHETT